MSHPPEVLRDASTPARHDAWCSSNDTSREYSSDGSPRCEWCDEELPEGMRRDARHCSQRCRQANHRFKSAIQVAATAAVPVRLAYADPPYPGKAGVYADHPDYAGEVDHLELLSRLQEYDGWALSTSSDALAEVLALCAELELELEPRVAAWFRGSRKNRSREALRAWEPVLFVPGRGSLARRDQPDDALVYGSKPRTTDPRRVTGAKPAAFASWMFALLGARRGDTLDDLYPGSGGIGRAWRLFTAKR